MGNCFGCSEKVKAKVKRGTLSGPVYSIPDGASLNPSLPPTLAQVVDWEAHAAEMDAKLAANPHRPGKPAWLTKSLSDEVIHGRNGVRRPMRPLAPLRFSSDISIN